MKIVKIAECYFDAPWGRYWVGLLTSPASVILALFVLKASIYVSYAYVSNSVKYMPPDGFFGIHIIQNSMFYVHEKCKMSDL